MDNSYLFDTASGVVLATDNRQRNTETTELVTEYLSRFMQFRELYKYVPPLRPNSSVHHRLWTGTDSLSQKRQDGVEAGQSPVDKRTSE